MSKDCRNKPELKALNSPTEQSPRRRELNYSFPLTFRPPMGHPLVVAGKGSENKELGGNDLYLSPSFRCFFSCGKLGTPFLF